MRLVRYRTQGLTHLGAWRPDGVVDLVTLGFPAMIEDFLCLSPERQQEAEMQAQHATTLLPHRELQLVTPLTHPSKIVAIGVNYLDHCREQGIDPPSAPLVFAKFPPSLSGPHDPITWNSVVTQQVDPEVELGVIIGRRCRDVTQDDTLAYVFGYTVVNDVSARDLQFGDR